MRLTPILCLALLATASTALAESKATGTHFVVIDHGEGGLAKPGLEAVEAVWAAAAKLLKAPTRAPKTPLEVHLYPTIAAYEAAEQKLTAGKFKTNLAFSHHQTRSSHVALQPPCTAATLKRIGLPELTRRLIVHEAAHLAVFTLVPATFKQHPFWLAEGLTSWIEESVHLDKKWVARVEADPYFGDRAVEMQAHLAKQTLPPIADVVKGEWGALRGSDRYAYVTQLFGFLLRKRSKEFRRFLGDLRRMGGGGDVPARLAAKLEASFSKRSWNGLDRAFQADLRAQKPAWDEVFRSLETHGPEWVQVAFPKTNAIAWSTQRLGPTFRVEGRFELLPQPRGQLNLLLGRDASGFVSVAITSGYVTVFHYHAQGSRWVRLGGFEARTIKAGDRVAFRLVARKGELRIALGGKELGAVATKGRTLAGPWGLGAQAGSGGVWSQVSVKTR